MRGGGSGIVTGLGQTLETGVERMAAGQGQCPGFGHGGVGACRSRDSNQDKESERHSY